MSVGAEGIKTVQGLECYMGLTGGLTFSPAQFQYVKQVSPLSNDVVSTFLLF